MLLIVGHYPFKSINYSKPYLGDSAFIRLCAPITDPKSNSTVMSLGLLYDNKGDDHQVLYYDPSRLGREGKPTILRRRLSDMKFSELESLHIEYVQKLTTFEHLRKLYPVEISKTYDALRDKNFYTVDIWEIRDGVQMEFAQCHNVIDMDMKGCNTYYFSDFDDAVGFACDASHNLRYRGFMMVDENQKGKERYCVYYNSRNHYLENVAKLNNGTVKFYGGYGCYKGYRGEPVMKFKFNSFDDLFNFRSGTHDLETGAVDCIVHRTTDPQARSFTAMQRAVVEAFVHQMYDPEYAIDHLFKEASYNKEFCEASHLWRDAVREEIESFAFKNDIKVSLKELMEMRQNDENALKL